MNQAKTPAQIRAILLGIIEKMANDPDRFVVRLQKDFTRNRICTMPNVICNLITAENHTLNRELFSFYSSLKMKIPTKSAFIQARSKLKPEAFQYLLNEFNKSFPFRKTFCGFPEASPESSPWEACRIRDMPPAGWGAPFRLGHWVRERDL